MRRYDIPKRCSNRANYCIITITVKIAHFEQCIHNSV